MRVLVGLEGAAGSTWGGAGRSGTTYTAIPHGVFVRRGSRVNDFQLRSGFRRWSLSYPPDARHPDRTFMLT